MLRIIQSLKSAPTKLKDRIQGKAPKGSKRSPKWPALRKKHLKENPKCAHCGSVKKLEVHHLKPFHAHPELELDPKNLITLCESKERGVDCHRFVGHLGNYRLINVKTLEMVALYQAALYQAALTVAAPDQQKQETP
jgi:5-methylcytosine-specific restriction protein A